MSEGTKKSAAPAEHERTPFGNLEFRHHPTDTVLDLRAHGPEDLFRLAAWGLARVLWPKWSGEAGVEESVDLASDGWDDQIVNWLNELIALAEKHRAIWTEIEFERLDESELRARVGGVSWPEGADGEGRDVKSAAYVGLELIPGPALWQARVTLEL